MSSETERTIHELQASIAELRARLEEVTSERDFLRRLLRESSVSAANTHKTSGEDRPHDHLPGDEVDWDESLIGKPSPPSDDSWDDSLMGDPSGAGSGDVGDVPWDDSLMGDPQKQKPPP